MADMHVREHVSLQTYTTLKVGGSARYFIEATSEAIVPLAVRFAKERQLPLFVLGAGSNVLVPDGEYEGVVLHIQLRGRTHRVDEKTQTILYTVSAGEDLDTCVAEAVAAGWWGLENLSAIPSSVGAVPVQNVGAYGVEASQVISSVQVYDRIHDAILTLTNSDCQFGYRDSIFKHEIGKNFIVLSVTFALSLVTNPQLHYKDLNEYFGETLPTLSDIRTAVTKIRAGKFPDWKKVGTAGSFFKNPVVATHKVKQLLEKYPSLPVYETSDRGYQKVSLGYILDKVCGLKGYQQGPVGLYEQQALVLTVVPHTEASLVEDFAGEIAQKVFYTTDLEIEWEVVRLQ